jgi:hypothetical protein
MPNDENQGEELVEVYRSSSELEVNRVLDELLGPEEIQGFVHNRTSSALPAPSSETGAYFIAVSRAQEAAARRVLERARDDGELDPSTGEII